MFAPTDIFGEVAYLGLNRDRAETLESAPVDHVRVTLEGFDGESHGGITRASCSRVMRQYKKGTEIRNARQVSILSVEELTTIGDMMGLGAAVRPEWVGANIVFRGIPALSELPPSSRLIFENGTSLVVDVENGPCKFPAEIIETHHPGKGLAFPKHARGKRGVVGWVERVGDIALGDRCRLHIPPQRIYAPAAGPRSPRA